MTYWASEKTRYLFIRKYPQEIIFIFDKWPLHYNINEVPFRQQSCPFNSVEACHLAKCPFLQRSRVYHSVEHVLFMSRIVHVILLSCHFRLEESSLSFNKVVSFICSVFSLNIKLKYISHYIRLNNYMFYLIG